MIAFLTSHFLIMMNMNLQLKFCTFRRHTPNTYIHTLGIWGFHQTRVYEACISMWSVGRSKGSPYHLLHTSNQLWWTAERTGLFVFALPWPFKDNVKVMVRRKNKTLCTRTRREGGFDLIIRTRKKLFVRCSRLG